MRKRYEPTVKRARAVVMMSAAEENALAARIMTGDTDARDTLIEANLWLVAANAKRFFNQGLEIEDVYQAGVFGLISAAEHARPNSEARFSTIATYRIFGAMQRSLSEHGSLIRPKSGAKDALRAASKAEAELEALIGRPASFEELAAHLHLSPRRAETLRDARATHRRVEDDPEWRGGRLDRVEARHETGERERSEADQEQDRQLARIDGALARLRLALPEAADALRRLCGGRWEGVTAVSLAGAVEKADKLKRRQPRTHRLVMESVAWIRNDLAGDDD